MVCKKASQKHRRSAIVVLAAAAAGLHPRCGSAAGGRGFGVVAPALLCPPVVAVVVAAGGAVAVVAAAAGAVVVVVAAADRPFFLPLPRVPLRLLPPPLSPALSVVALTFCLSPLFFRFLSQEIVRKPHNWGRREGLQLYPEVRRLGGEDGLFYVVQTKGHDGRLVVCTGLCCCCYFCFSCL